MDLIALVDAKDTPVVSMAKKGSKPGNMYFRWQADSLPSVKAGGVADGTDVSSYDSYVYDGSTSYRAELANYAQIFRRAVRVSKLSQDIADVAGVRDNLAVEVSKALTGIKRDMEHTFCSNQIAIADNGTVGYRTGGLQRWTTNGDSNNATDVNITSGSTIAVPARFVTRYASIVTGSNASGLTDTNVQDLLKSIYEQTGQSKALDAVVGTALKRAFTGLLSTTTLTTTSTGGVTGAGATAVKTFSRDAAASTYLQAVDIFQGDFGTLRLHPTTFIGTVGTAGAGTDGAPTPASNATTTQNYKGLVLDMDLIEVRYGGNGAEVTELPNSGGGPARLVEAVAGLVVANPLGLGKFDFSAA